ncbi:MAG: hypothetical protein ACTHM6_04235 [Tepidisphaeraceae bacterium]
MPLPCAFAALLVTAAASTTSPADLGSPKSAFLAYTDAIEARNFDALKGMVIADDLHLKMLKGQLDYNEIEQRFHAAADKAFPGQTGKPNDTAARLRQSIEKADVQFSGNTVATLTTPQTVRAIQLRREGGDWKVDLNSMYPPEVVAEVADFRKALADMMAAITPLIEQGKYKTYNDVKSDLEVRVKMRLATPSESGSTQPSL